jgi:hypothetical protein
LNAPEEFVVRLRACPVAVLVIVTLAPLSTAPLGSLTVPTMLPVPTVAWATAIAENSSTKKAVMNARRPNRVPCRGELRFNIVHLPFGIFITNVVLSELVLAANRTTSLSET